MRRVCRGRLERLVQFVVRQRERRQSNRRVSKSIKIVEKSGG